MKTTLKFLIVSLLLSAVMVSCTATQQGAVAGGAIGAGTGAIIGHQSGHTGEGAVIGGAIGAVSGGLIGHGIDHN
ncbi:MAG: cell envelope biogenesis protein OmpA [Candidatus Lindowbacteria bacterium]|nr:cell envelope biogenesis protein OmpA [Candidatus Lindowbacteria bacterium]